MDVGITADPDLHLTVGGRRVEPMQLDGLTMFRLPLPARDVRLVSRAERPSNMGIGIDTRLLGYGVTRLTLEQDGVRVSMPMTAPDLLEGFHECEDGAMRWTDGNALLPDALFAGARGMAVLGVGGFPLPSYRLHPETDPASTALFMQFENLGDNCEFGLAQRRFDAEPVSLLRWASTDAARLVAGLSNGFDGIGDPDRTRLVWSEETVEYKLQDSRYLTAHTWAQSRLDGPAEMALHLGGCARLRLLRRKLLADIAGARRIFVFKENGDAGFRAVHAALRAIGPANLLCVRPNACAADVGRVEAAGDGLFIGHIDRFVLADGPYDVWHRLCETTRSLIP